MTQHTHSDETGTLNTLITTLIDSVNGYEDAAANSEAGRFQQMFRERASERQRAVEELRAEVRRLGGRADQGHDVGGRHPSLQGRNDLTAELPRGPGNGDRHPGAPSVYRCRRCTGSGLFLPARRFSISTTTENAIAK